MRADRQSWERTSGSIIEHTDVHRNRNMGQGDHVITCDTLSTVDHEYVIQRWIYSINIVSDMMRQVRNCGHRKHALLTERHSCHIPSSLHKAEEVPISLYEQSVSKPPFTICLCYAFALC